MLTLFVAVLARAAEVPEPVRPAEERLYVRGIEVFDAAGHPVAARDFVAWTGDAAVGAEIEHLDRRARRAWLWLVPVVPLAAAVPAGVAWGLSLPPNRSLRGEAFVGAGLAAATSCVLGAIAGGRVRRARAVAITDYYHPAEIAEAVAQYNASAE